MIEVEVPAEDHPSRLASQHELARAYQANGQVKEAVKLLDHVVIVKRKVMAEDHPSRLVSERVLAAFYEDLPKRSETGQTSASFIGDLGAEDEDGRQFYQAPEVPQAISSNSSAFVTRSGWSSADQEFKSSSTSKRRHLLRRLRDMLRKK